jgi:hypothetical protein
VRAFLAGVLLLGLTACGGHSGCQDALTDRALTQLHGFTGWLHAHHVQGVVGEVGWPAGRGWQHVATSWYAAAGDLDTYAWAGAEQWPTDYPLAVYRSSDPTRPGARLDVAGPQAPVVEHHGRRVDLADGSFGAGTATYSAARPGAYGTAYRYPSRGSLLWLRHRGIRSVRVALEWERLQPTPGGPLVAAEVQRLRQVLDAGLPVVLDLHSYGRFTAAGPRVLLLGSPQLPAERLADLWRRLAHAVAGSPSLAGYGLMNEPHDLPGGAAGWERASQLAVSAIRAVDRRTPVLVAGYSSSGAATWSRNHPRPWITGGGPLLYEAHQYFDRDGSGRYAAGWSDELAYAEHEGYGCAT